MTTKRTEGDFLTELERHMRRLGTLDEDQITGILQAASGWVFSFPQAVQDVQVLEGEAPAYDEDDRLFCEACGLEMTDKPELGRSVEAPGIPSGEIIVCAACARELKGGAA
jgi:hypothetical protein